MDSTAIERIELRIAYLESASQELSDTVYRQQREIETLRAQLAAYQRRMESWSGDSAAPPLAEEIPPHY